MISTSKAIRFSEYGDPEVLRFGEVELPAPATGELQIRHEAIGLNFIDIYHRKGIYAAKLSLPSGLGIEGVGVVLAVGADAAGFQPGDRVAYAGGPPGAYATNRNLPATRAVKVPEGLDSELVAASFFKGLTAEYLAHRCVSVAAGDDVLVHAAAGGVGSLVCQFLHHLGARVIGTVGGPEKIGLARQNGCDGVIDYRSDDFVARVRQLTEGRGVRVVYDSVGADTFAGSLDCLAPRGTLVSFGESSGPVAPLAVSSLGVKGSLFVTRPSIAHYTADPVEYRTAAERLFSALKNGSVKNGTITRYALNDAARAQADMEERRTMGSVVVIP